MYHLLVEAAGIRQVARIHPDFHRRFVENLDTTLHDHGFGPAGRDGDLFLFREYDGVRTQPRHVATVIRRVLQVLRDETDDLLDVVVLMDYRSMESSHVDVHSFQRLLRFARSQNAAYITTTVMAAIAPLVETVQQGELHRIVAFLGEGGPQEESFHTALYRGELVERLHIAMEDDRNDGIWIVGTDTSVVPPALSRVREHPTGDADDVWVVAQCRPDTPAVFILQAVLAGLPLPRDVHPAKGDDPTHADDPTAHMQWVLSLTRRRLRRPTAHLLSEGWRAGEVSLALRRSLTDVSSRFGRITVELRDLDLCEPDVVAEVLAHCAVTTDHGAVRVIVSARTGPEEVFGRLDAYRWNLVSGEDGADRYAAADQYWTRERSDPRTLPENHRRTLFLLHRLGGVVDEQTLNHIFPAVGITLAERSRVFNELTELGLLLHLCTVEVHPAVDRFAPSLIDPEEREAIDAAIVPLLEEDVRRGALLLSPSVWPVMVRHVEGPAHLERRHALLHNLAGGAAFGAFHRLERSLQSTDAASQAVEVSARIRLFLRDSRGPEQCRGDAERLQATLAEGILPVRLHADALLSVGEFFLAERNYDAALKSAKQATIMHQQADSGAVGAGHLLMARILLARRRLNDVGRYVRFAQEESGDDPATAYIARTLAAVHLFLTGNLSRAIVQLRELVEPLVRSGFSEWLMLVWFTLGRIRFELGDYQRAAVQFSVTASWAEECGMEVPARTIAVWAERSRAVGEGTGPFRYTSGEPTAEELLFAAETMIRDGRYDDALELLERADRLERAVDRWPRLGVCWDNGFAPLEDLIIADQRERSELLRLIAAFRGWTLARVGRPDEAIPLFYRLTRGNDGLGLDPYGGMYNYLYSSILPKERSTDRDDRLTVLGKSVKLVQERMSRMDDYRDKMRYVKDNIWNRRLMEEARRYNLV